MEDVTELNNPPEEDGLKLFRVKIELERFFWAKDEGDALEQFGDNMQFYEIEGFMEPDVDEIAEEGRITQNRG